VSRGHLAWILTMSSAWHDADAAYAALLPELESVYGEGHPYTAQMRLESAHCPLRLGRLDDAETRVRRALTALERRLAPDHIWLSEARLLLAEVAFRKGDHAAAIDLAEGVVAGRRAAGTLDQDLGHALVKLGRCYQEADDPRAIEVFREAADVHRRVFGASSDFLAQALYNLGVATRDLGDPAEAVEPLQQALALDIGIWGPDHRHVVSDRFDLARTLRAAGKHSEAVEQLRLALASAERNGTGEERRL